jgi:hypothetical protein
MSLAEDVNMEEFVMSKDDLSGADIKAICTESGLIALRERRMKVSMADFRKAKDKVLYRKKEAFSDGVSNQDKKWYKYLQEHFDKEVGDCNLNNNEWSYLPPVTKEAYYYRYIFECLLPSKCSRVIPHYWLPSWCGEVNEPSATILSCYDETN